MYLPESWMLIHNYGLKSTERKNGNQIKDKLMELLFLFNKHFV